jgi:hypothetical protein
VVWCVCRSALACCFLSSLWYPAAWWALALARVFRKKEFNLLPDLSDSSAIPITFVNDLVTIMAVALVGNLLLTVGCALAASLTKRLLLGYVVRLNRTLPIHSWTFLCWIITDNMIAAADWFILSFHRGTAWHSRWLTSLGLDSAGTPSLLSLWLIPRADTHLVNAEDMLCCDPQDDAYLAAAGINAPCTFLGANSVVSCRSRIET